MISKLYNSPKSLRIPPSLKFTKLHFLNWETFKSEDSPIFDRKRFN